MVATGVAAKFGILIKGGDILENSANIKTIIFDKTGTLTEGKPKVIFFNTFTEVFPEEDILTMVQSIESKSEHVLAKSICKFTNKITLPCEDFINLPGEGVIGSVKLGEKSVKVCIGNMKIVNSMSLKVSKSIIRDYERYENEGKTIMIAFADGYTVGLIGVAESELVKPEAPWVISKLHEMGLDV